jgi:hypothetical protein
MLGHSRVKLFPGWANMLGIRKWIACNICVSCEEGFHFGAMPKTEFF